MSKTVDGTAIALALAQNLLLAAGKALTAVNQARLENRPVSDAELGQLASADALERARESAGIEQARAEGR